MVGNFAKDKEKMSVASHQSPVASQQPRFSGGLLHYCEYGNIKTAKVVLTLAVFGDWRLATVYYFTVSRW